RLVARSPAVAMDPRAAAAARRPGIEATREIDLFFRACPARIAGITGTNGKTTTTALTTEVLRAGGLTVMRGGNIGEPVLDRLDQLGAEDWGVLALGRVPSDATARPPSR